MLDAFIRKGARRILLTRTTEHQKDKNEDAITSMVFSPIQFMSPEDAFTCFKAVLPNLPRHVTGQPVSSVHVEFWPSVMVEDARVEPDLRAEIRFADYSSLVLIGEMKWGSVITREQIHKERETVNGGDAYVFAIIKTRGTCTADGLGCNELRTWTDVHRSICDLSGSQPSSSVRRWATLVSEFLEIAEQLVFNGFREINIHELPKSDQSTIFFGQNNVNGHLNRQFKLPGPEAALEEKDWIFYNRRART